MEKQETYTTAVAELTNGIILSKFVKPLRTRDSYQTETELEMELLHNLKSQGYQFINIKSSSELYANLKTQLEKLNKVEFSESEWERFLSEYLDIANEGMIEKTRKIQEDYVNDFMFDNGYIKNIYLLDKTDIHNNILQVTHQVVQHGKHENRYDVTILVNGLPLVQIELKKRGVNLVEAFHQIHRYSKESYNSEDSLFKFIQIFIISNGTNTRYFANTTASDKNNYEFTCEWADAKNRTINDLVDFTATFLEKRTLLEVLMKYCVFTVDDVLLIMRPYQIAATERILWKIESSYQNKNWGNVESGGYIWHTTGSGKTLTSFKTARIATKLPYIDKVLFVVDRKDLDYQTMKEYQKFQADSVNGSKNTKQLKSSLENDEGKIVVTTIQKLNEFMKKNEKHEIFSKNCVLIFDECHRSQFGEAQKKIQKSFKKYYQFGFTGTPIFPENAVGVETTASVFGRELHSYIITDAIRDKKVLKFKVDYNAILAKYKDIEKKVGLENNEAELKKLERKALLHPDRIEAITTHVLKVFNAKTHRNEYYNHRTKSLNGFNAMFAVQNIEAAKMYYEEFAKQQASLPVDKRLKVATIYSYTANETQGAIGDITDETFEPTALDSTAKEFLVRVIDDYNTTFRTNYSIDGTEFQNYYKDLAKRVKNKEVDLIIVVGMFLTGFDAPTLNTLFVDKNLRYHGLIQAYSRTNRILNKVKTFGNIVCFRDLEEATKEAIKCFGEANDINIILEKKYSDYMSGFVDIDTGETIEGYESLCKEMMQKFPEPTEIALDVDKKEFCRLFGEILKVENILKNYDEFTDTFDPIISQGLMQDMKSVYVDIKEEIRNYRINDDQQSTVDFSDIEFQVDLLKTEEINLDYILSLIFDKSREHSDSDTIKVEVRRILRSSLGTRAKEELVISFIDEADFDELNSSEKILVAFYEYARAKRGQAISNLIIEEKLKEEDARRFIDKSIEKGFATGNGTELDSLLPPTSRRAGAREHKKTTVLEKIKRLVDIFMDI